MLLSRQDLLTVYKWKPGKHKLLSQFWAGRRLAAAACGVWSGCVCTGVDAALRFCLTLSKVLITAKGLGCQGAAVQKALAAAPMIKITFEDGIIFLF